MVLSQKAFPDTETQFFVRDKNNLGDILYEIGSQYKNKNNMNLFQNIDFIFMEGDVTILPWQSHYENAHILIRMCLNYGKRCFVSGGLSNCIIYQSSDRIHGYNPIVHCDRNIEELFQQLILNNQLNVNDYLVESTTGDVYHFEKNYESNQIVTPKTTDIKKKEEITQKGNLGLHREKDAEDNHQIGNKIVDQTQILWKFIQQCLGKFVLKSSVYRDQQQYGQKLIVSRITEELIYVHKKHNCHYLLNSLPFQLKINTDNRKWNVHPYAIQNNLFRYDIIAESAKSKTSIIQMSNNPNIIALFFIVDQNYDQSYQLMKNFFNEKVNEMGFNRNVLQSPVKAFSFIKQQRRTFNRQDNDSENNHANISPISFIRNGKSSPIQQKQVLEHNWMNEETCSSSLSRRTGLIPSFKDQLATTNINQTTYSHISTMMSQKNNGQLHQLSRTTPIQNYIRTNEQKSLSPIRSRNTNRDTFQNNRSFQNDEDRVFVHQCVNPFDQSRNSRMKAENTLIDTSTLFTTRRGKEVLQKTPKQIRDISLIKEKTTFNKKLLLISDVSLDQFQQFQNNSGPKLVSQNRPFLNLKKYTEEESTLGPYVCINDHKYRDESPNKWIGSPWKKI